MYFYFIHNNIADKYLFKKNRSEKTFNYLLIGLLLFTGTKAFSASIKKLSEQAQISILIGNPSNKNLYSMFGHAGLRINDPGLAVDYVFNYNIKPASTKLAEFFQLYEKNISSELFAVHYADIEAEYRNDQRALNELLLNFSQEEKEKLWQMLMNIVQTQNVSYYDILKHNCTALPLALIEKSTTGTIRFSQEESGGSYRSYFNSCLREYPWTIFGVNISLGWATDRLINFRESFFLPRNFEEGLLSAKVIDSMGNMHPLIVHNHFLVPLSNRPSILPFFTPVLCAWLLLAVVVLLSGFEWKRNQLIRPIDAVLFAIAGVGGCYLFYIQFIVKQWYFFPNWWIFWLHPLHLLGAAVSATKRFDRVAIYYHIFNLAALSIMLIGTCFIPQYYYPAFVPLIIVIILRSIIRIRVFFNKYIHF